MCFYLLREDCVFLRQNTLRKVEMKPFFCMHAVGSAAETLQPHIPVVLIPRYAD